ncbi:cyclohexyl-isocyanide hydratase [Devosia enhydra]|uniref:Cyclohexyl-isocyanide hydratase n=1 Tax=Devosia enhydra TaxID=665118 RepID=A0A1K2I202_9HYPH|nr:DJ-1/PfpI family protein [Devosia enhydra]SFZ86414.1 cyclohexyl-isocyanide hydratase [Devosia enhydra]
MLFPRLTQLDLTAPLEVFGRMAGVEISLIWKTLDPVASDRGLRLLPTHTFEAAPALDLICVPGGPGQIDLMDDAETLAFLRAMAPKCRWVTSVCTGSLVLAAAGLLTGYRATSHWSSIDQLALFGATPVSERVVRDRNRITGAGVTSGIDFGLAVAAEVLGAEAASRIRLQIEYDPPALPGGSPATADPAVLTPVQQAMAGFIAKRRAASEAAARRLHAHQT